jgi:hypothetical protein
MSPASLQVLLLLAFVTSAASILALLSSPSTMSPSSPATQSLRRWHPPAPPTRPLSPLCLPLINISQSTSARTTIRSTSPWTNSSLFTCYAQPPYLTSHLVFYYQTQMYRSGDTPPLMSRSLTISSSSRCVLSIQPCLVPQRNRPLVHSLAANSAPFELERLVARRSETTRLDG